MKLTLNRDFEYDYHLVPLAPQDHLLAIPASLRRPHDHVLVPPASPWSSLTSSNSAFMSKASSYANAVELEEVACSTHASFSHSMSRANITFMLTPFKLLASPSLEWL